jgi:hypothetical protein
MSKRGQRGQERGANSTVNEYSPQIRPRSIQTPPAPTN